MSLEGLLGRKIDSSQLQFKTTSRTYDREPKDGVMICLQPADQLRQETGEETRAAADEEERQRQLTRAKPAKHEAEKQRGNVH